MLGPGSDRATASGAGSLAVAKCRRGGISAVLPRNREDAELWFHCVGGFFVMFGPFPNRFS